MEQGTTDDLEEIMRQLMPERINKRPNCVTVS